MHVMLTAWILAAVLQLLQKLTNAMRSKEQVKEVRGARSDL